MKKTILFQGDSITDCRRNLDKFYDLGKGYPGIIKNHYGNREDLVFVNRGVNGDRICHLRKRWEEDCMAIKPDILFIFVGVNDVLVQIYENFITPLDEFERDYRYVLDQVKDRLPNTKIVIIGPQVQPINEQMSQLKAHLQYNIKIIEKIAEEYAEYYIPMETICDRLAKIFEPNDIAEDGVHFTPLGYSFLTDEIIKVLDVMLLDK